MLQNRVVPEKGELNMENDATIGWIAAIVIGGIAGWLAEQFMKSDAGMLMNIALGIVGAIVANAILSFVGINLGGWLGYLIAGFIGACILIAIGRMLRRATWATLRTSPRFMPISFPTVVRNQEGHLTLC